MDIPLQVSVAQENAPFITLNNKPFYLKQFHFHTQVSIPLNANIIL